LFRNSTEDKQKDRGEETDVEEKDDIFGVKSEQNLVPKIQNLY